MSEDIFGQDEPVEEGSGDEFVEEEGSGDEPVEEEEEEEEEAAILQELLRSNFEAAAVEHTAELAAALCTEDGDDGSWVEAHIRKACAMQAQHLRWMASRPSAEATDDIIGSPFGAREEGGFLPEGGTIRLMVDELIQTDIDALRQTLASLVEMQRAFERMGKDSLLADTAHLQEHMATIYGDILERRRPVHEDLDEALAGQKGFPSLAVAVMVLACGFQMAWVAQVMGYAQVPDVVGYAQTLVETLQAAPTTASPPEV